jgi:hypothetical protein
MRQRQLSLADIFLIGGTRVALGVGIGLLISERFNSDQRRGAGWALVGLGVLTTIPLAIKIASNKAPLAAVDDKQAA